MAINDKHYGSSVSRHLPAGERSWAEAIYQTGRPVLDAELNLTQEIQEVVQNLLWNRTIPSGWLRGPGHRDPFQDFVFGTDVNAFTVRKRTALVAGMPVVLEYANTATPGLNLIQLDPAPLIGGAPPDVKRTDFVFLEVWRAFVANSPSATGTVQVVAVPTTATLTIGGTALTPAGGPRTPGSDDYDNTIAINAAAMASEIAAAINDPANSFTGVVTASISPTATDTVILTSVVSGVAGNAITLVEGSGGTEFVLSGPNLVGGVDKPNKPTQDTIYRHGNVQAPGAVNLPDDLEDPALGVETTARVQVQYRIRVTGQDEAVNFKTEGTGFSNASLEAQGAQASPVATYPFVPADRTTVNGNSSAVAYGIEDNGLWVAGDGTSTAATNLGTVDGFVYAIPLCFVFRRNDAYNGGAGDGFDPLNNTNGALPQTHPGFANPIIGAIPANTSDRPDGKFHDRIDPTDVLDLRRQVVPGGVDLSAELKFQMQALLDGNFATWAIDAADKQVLGAGSGDVATRFLVCNEVGRSASEGGVAPNSGDTTRGVTVANFDHVRRRFADQPVVERLVLSLLPGDDVLTNAGKFVTQDTPGYNGWSSDDVLHIDLSALNATTLGDWDPTGITYTGGSGGSVLGFAPPGTRITNVLGAWHDDGNYGTAVNQEVQFSLVTGIGSSHLTMTLDANATLVNGGLPGPTNRMVGDSLLDDGSQRRIFVEVEVTYPLGSGTTDTPDEILTPNATVYPEGPVRENNTAQRPLDFEDLPPVRFRDSRREVVMEYVANQPGSGIGSGTPITDTVVSRNPQDIYTLRRLHGSGALATGVVDQADAQPHDVDPAVTEWGSSSRRLALDISGGAPERDPLSGAGQTLVQVSYFAQDPIPNYGATGYQLAVYYRSNAPQTAGSRDGTPNIPATLTVQPLVMSMDLWSGQTGPGSVDIPYPYANPLDQIAVNDGGTATFPGDWYFAATAMISVDDFSAETGLLNLHTKVPVDGTGSFTFSGRGTDTEFRTFYGISDPASYRPTVFAQPHSNIVRHKVWMPFLVRATENTALWRKHEVLLVVLSRWAELDEENTIRFVNADNRSAAAIYRTKGLLLLAGE